MKYVWFALLAVGVVFGIFTGQLADVTESTFAMAETSVELAIGLIGVMALWLGLMRIAEEAGFLQFVARLLRPVLVRLFPEVPTDHPAMGSMLANIAANILGLSNAATPLGLRAMQDLQKINKDRKSASNAMATFLTINTSSVTLIPATVIGIRASAGSASPAEIIGTTIIATVVSTAVGLTAVKVFQKFAAPQIESSPDRDADSPEHEEDHHG